MNLRGGSVNLLESDAHDQIADAHGPNTTRLLDLERRYDQMSVFTATPLPTRPGRHLEADPERG